MTICQEPKNTGTEIITRTINDYMENDHKQHENTLQTHLIVQSIVVA